MTTDPAPALPPPRLPWQLRLRLIVETMRELSRQTDPLEMGTAYRARMQELLPSDGFLSVSRRDLINPLYRITRSSRWDQPLDPWQDRDRLPLLRGGVLADLVYGDEPVMLDDFAVPAGDPAADYLAGYRSLWAVPLYDRGQALNLNVLLRRSPAAFRPEQFPEIVWMSNLFGRATHALVAAKQAGAAFAEVDREMRTVARIQRSLLPAELPTIPTLDLAVHYQTSARAGGDYYDLFPLPDGRCGILIADVSGHGTPAAVLMAVTHAIAHTHPGPPFPPDQLLGRLNRVLAERYTPASGTFVTAFYGVYNPFDRSLTYANAGHPPPRWKSCADGSRASLDAAGGFPLGIDPDSEYPVARWQLHPGDQVVFYTDGVTEAMDPHGVQFGVAGLDAALAACPVGADTLLDILLFALAGHAGTRPADDDRTLLVAKVT